MERSVDRRPPSGMTSAFTFNHGDVRQLAPAGPVGTPIGAATISGSTLTCPAAAADYLSIAGGPATNFGNGVGVDDDPFTIMGWFSPDSWPASYNKLFFKHNAGLTSDGMQLTRRSTNRQDFHLGNAWTGGGKYLYARYDVTTPTGAYAHFCIRYDGLRAYTGIDFFYNGVKQTRTSGSASGYNGSVATDQALHSGEGFGCDLSDQFMFKRYLSDDEITSIFNQGHRT